MEHSHATIVTDCNAPPDALRLVNNPAVKIREIEAADPVWGWRVGSATGPQQPGAGGDRGRPSRAAPVYHCRSPTYRQIRSRSLASRTTRCATRRGRTAALQERERFSMRSRRTGQTGFYGHWMPCMGIARDDMTVIRRTRTRKFLNIGTPNAMGRWTCRRAPGLDVNLIVDPERGV